MSCVDVGSGDDRTSLHIYEKLAFHLASEWQSEVIMTKTYFWRRGEIVFQPKSLTNSFYEGKKTHVFEVEPGSAYRVFPNGKNHLFLQSISDSSLYVPFEECIVAPKELLEGYEKLYGV